MYIFETFCIISHDISKYAYRDISHESSCSPSLADQVLQAVADVAVESDLLETAEALVTEGHLPLELPEQWLDEVDEVKVQVMWV